MHLAQCLMHLRCIAGGVALVPPQPGNHRLSVLQYAPCATVLCRLIGLSFSLQEHFLLLAPALSLNPASLSRQY